MKSLIKQLFNTFGLDVVQLPHPDSLGRHLSNLFDRKSVNFVIDVGAHHGEFAKFLRGIGYKGIIHSFEPVKESFLQLQNNASGDVNWFTHQIALGASSQRKNIHVSDSNVMSSFLNTSSFARDQFKKDSVVLYEEEVTVERLDLVFSSLIGKIETPQCYLKLDTQGWDLDVVEGSSACLKYFCAMQSEISFKPIYEGMPTYMKSIETLAKLDFVVSGMFPVKHDVNGAVIEMDCVLINTH